MTTEEKLDAHVVGVMFAQHFSLKKGLELFEDKVDVTVHKQLIHIRKNGYVQTGTHAWSHNQGQEKDPGVADVYYQEKELIHQS